MADADGFTYYKMSLDDAFWWLFEEFGRYEIQTLDESGDVLSFSFDTTTQQPVVKISREDGSYSKYMRQES